MVSGNECRQMKTATSEVQRIFWRRFGRNSEDEVETAAALRRLCPSFAL
jgi:hypothetical protein